MKKIIKKSIHGKEISREEAYEGLGDPSTWEDFKKRLMEDFKKKPKTSGIISCSLCKPGKKCPRHKLIG